MSNPNKPSADKQKKHGAGKPDKTGQQRQPVPPYEKEKAFDTQSEFTYAVLRGSK